MFSKDAIQQLTQAEAVRAAAFAVGAGFDATRGAVALPTDFTIRDVEKFMSHRRRARGTVSTPFIGSFVGYVNKHKEEGTTVFVNSDKMGATAVLNLGTSAAPGHADNLAKLELDQTAAYSALRAHTSRGFTQTEIAEFLEDWPEHLQFFKDAVAVPPPHAIAAVRKLTVEAIKRLENTEQNLSAQRTAFESVAASSTEPLPTHIYFTCQPYADLEPRVFVMRLSVLTGDAKPRIQLRVSKMESHLEEMALELAAKVRAALGTDNNGIPVAIGTYSRAE